MPGEPTILRYWVEEVEVPAPVSHEQAELEALGAVPRAPRGPARRMLRVVVEGEGFPQGETPFGITVGGQQLSSLNVLGDGSRLAGLVEEMPSPGDTVAFHFPSGPPGEPGPREMIAGVIAPELLDEGLA